MSTIYDRGRALAIRQLAPLDQGGKGQRLQLTYTVPGVYDPDTQSTGPDTVTVQEVSGVEVRITAERVNGTSILTGDSILKISPVQTNGADVIIPPDAAATSTVTFATGTVKTIVAVDPKAPAGLVIAVELQLRGA